MSVQSTKQRPSASLGIHPLVGSQSAPQLQSAASTGPRPMERPTRDSPSPEPVTRLVNRLHPVIGSTGASSSTRQDAKREARQESKQESQPAAPQDTKSGTAPGPLVRFVGGFMHTPESQLEEENDVLTVLVDSIQRSSQQQPDSAMPSSGDTTPLTRPASPRAPDEADSPHRAARFRLPSRDNTN